MNAHSHVLYPVLAPGWKLPPAARRVTEDRQHRPRPPPPLKSYPLHAPPRAQQLWAHACSEAASAQLRSYPLMCPWAQHVSAPHVRESGKEVMMGPQNGDVPGGGGDDDGGAS